MPTHFIRLFVANLKIDAICTFYPESFCDKNLAIWKVFAFCDSGQVDGHVDVVGQVDGRLAMLIMLVKSMAMLMVLVGIMGDD